MENQDNLTKKQRRELKRQEKLERREEAVKKHKMSRIALWGGIIVFIVALVLGMMQVVKSKQGETAGDQDNAATVAAIAPDDQQRGANASAIEVIEYGDYQCPACAQVHPIVEQLVEKYGENILFAFRHFPLRQIHQNGQIASQAVEAAGRQGKYWEMHGKLFDRQSDWSKERSPEDLFVQYAGEIGVDTEQFKNDLKSDEVKDAVASDYESGIKANVSGTPAFFLNGEQVDNPGILSAWEKLLDPLITAAAQDAADAATDQSAEGDAAVNTNDEVNTSEQKSSTDQE